MTNLLLAILCASILYFVFKLYSKYNINTFQAIVFNYATACLVGLVFTPRKNISLEGIFERPWLIYSFVLGFMFITVFNILGKTSQVNGVTVASVASKMSMIIPILFGILFLNEKLSFQKIIGILLAIIAVYFVSKKSEIKTSYSTLLLPILLFIGAGTIDTSMNYIQLKFLKQNEISIFSSTTFLVAFSIGISILLYQITTKKTTFEFKNIIGGIALGIPNYFSMYFLIKALQNPNIESATIFTLINIGVILLSTFFGILFFKESLKKQNYIGILLAIIAVFLLQ
ncbi:EamA family transporter [Flavobacterium chuncheonense]|uniref:EamA family transporter n=1 Tax=Flavobacterium chuncheonense TaxID=2026653 RepID=A0ABW5YJI4_9FLAO